MGGVGSGYMSLCAHAEIGVRADVVFMELTMNDAEQAPVVDRPSFERQESAVQYYAVPRRTVPHRAAPCRDVLRLIMSRLAVLLHSAHAALYIPLYLLHHASASHLPHTGAGVRDACAPATAPASPSRSFFRPLRPYLLVQPAGGYMHEKLLASQP